MACLCWGEDFKQTRVEQGFLITSVLYAWQKHRFYSWCVNRWLAGIYGAFTGGGGGGLIGCGPVIPGRTGSDRHFLEKLFDLGAGAGAGAAQPSGSQKHVDQDSK